MPELLSIAGPIVGGLMGSQGSSQQQQQKQELDPRIQGLLFGDGSANKGLLYGVQDLYNKQMGQGGLNPLQTAGLEMQRQYLSDPSYTQGYGAAKNLGMSLMGGGVAPNPFTAASNSNNSRWPAVNLPATGAAQYAPQNFQYTQNAATAGAYNPMAATQATTQTANPSPSASDLAEQERKRQLEQLMNSGEFYRGQGA